MPWLRGLAALLLLTAAGVRSEIPGLLKPKPSSVVRPATSPDSSNRAVVAESAPRDSASKRKPLASMLSGLSAQAASRPPATTDSVPSSLSATPSSRSVPPLGDSLSSAGPDSLALGASGTPSPVAARSLPPRTLTLRQQVMFAGGFMAFIALMMTSMQNFNP